VNSLQWPGKQGSWAGNIHSAIWVSSLTVGAYVASGGMFSAIFNEVLQFISDWLGELLIPLLALIEAGGWKGSWARESSITSRIQKFYP